MEVSKNHTNQINQEKSKESPSHPVSTPREDSQNGTKTTTAKVVSLSEFVIPISGQGINNKLNPQTTNHRSQNIHGNTGIYCTLGAAIVGFTLIGVILCATVNPIAGGIIIAATLFSLLGVVAMATYARQKEKPEMDTLTALGEVHTTELLNGKVDVAI